MRGLPRTCVRHESPRLAVAREGERRTSATLGSLACARHSAAALDLYAYLSAVAPRRRAPQYTTQSSLGRACSAPRRGRTWIWKKGQRQVRASKTYMVFECKLTSRSFGARRARIMGRLHVLQNVPQARTSTLQRTARPPHSCTGCPKVATNHAQTPTNCLAHLHSQPP